VKSLWLTKVGDLSLLYTGKHSSLRYSIEAASKVMFTLPCKDRKSAVFECFTVIMGF